MTTTMDKRICVDNALKRQGVNAAHQTLARRIHMKSFQSLLVQTIFAFGIAAVPQALDAQSAQAFSYQLAALSTSIATKRSSTAAPGYGGEVQLRYNRVYATESFGALSISLGGQWTTHSAGPDRMSISGLFVEPRWAPATASTRFFPYFAGRVATLRQNSNFGSGSGGSAYGGGGGLAVRLNRDVNLDAGIAIVRQQFNPYVSKVGSSYQSFEPFITYAAKLGLNIGIK
jgi:hypothetical protein